MEATFSVMVLAYGDIRDQLLAICDSLTLPYSLHASNFLFMMDFLIPVVHHWGHSHIFRLWIMAWRSDMALLMMPLNFYVWSTLLSASWRQMCTWRLWACISWWWNITAKPSIQPTISNGQLEKHEWRRCWTCQSCFESLYEVCARTIRLQGSFLNIKIYCC